MKKYLLTLLILLISTHNVFAHMQAERRQLLQTIKGLAIISTAIVGLTFLVAGGLSYIDAKLQLNDTESGRQEKKFGALFWKAFFEYLNNFFLNFHWQPIFTSYQPYFSHYHYSPPVSYHPPLMIQTYTPVYTPTYIPMYTPILIR